MPPTFDITPEKRATKLHFLQRQLLAEPPIVSKNEVDLNGKTGIVTGSNTGIGLECNRQLLDLGLSKLIIAVRNESKGEEAKKLLLSERNAGNQVIEVWKLDLASYDSIIAFVERAKSLERLNFVVNNAAIIKRSFGLNKATGHEESNQVNYLSVALLTLLLLPILKDKNSPPQQPGRIVLVNSDTPAWAKFKSKDSIPLLPTFDKPDFWVPADRYATSKLLCQLFLTELAKRVPPSVAIINTPNPGLCKTSILREVKRTFQGLMLGIMTFIIGRKAAVGARSLTDAAVKQGPESHGQYLEDGKIQPMAPFAYTPKGEKVAKLLWQETMDELSFARVDDIVKNLSS